MSHRHIDEHGHQSPAQSKIAKKLSAYDIGLRMRLSQARQHYLASKEEALHNYDTQSQKEWLRGMSPPKDGYLNIFRASPTGEAIRPGDYVTNQRSYAQKHMEANLGGEGKIASTKAHLSELHPADGPGEFWYYPHDETAY